MGRRGILPAASSTPSSHPIASSSAAESQPVLGPPGVLDHELVDHDTGALGKALGKAKVQRVAAEARCISVAVGIDPTGVPYRLDRLRGAPWKPGA